MKLIFAACLAVLCSTPTALAMDFVPYLKCYQLLRSQVNSVGIQNFPTGDKALLFVPSNELANQGIFIIADGKPYFIAISPNKKPSDFNLSLAFKIPGRSKLYFGIASPSRPSDGPVWISVSPEAAETDTSVGTLPVTPGDPDATLTAIEADLLEKLELLRAEFANQKTGLRTVSCGIDGADLGSVIAPCIKVKSAKIRSKTMDVVHAQRPSAPCPD